MTFVFPLLTGLAIGFTLALVWVWVRSTAQISEAVRLTTQMEERNRRVAELQAALAEREQAARQAVEQRASLEARLGKTQAELLAAERQSQEKLLLLQEARTRLEENFKALAGETLKANSESFMALAHSHLETLVAREDGNLERRRESIEALMRPLSDCLKRYEEGLHAVEKARDEAYAGLRQQAAQLCDGHEKLTRETANLVNALTRPQTRGRWGELTLHRAAELAGMTEHCDFSEQVTTADGRQRPDMLVHLPGDREVVVDAKVPLSAYLEALECTADAERHAKFLQHAGQVRAHLDLLASKDYTRQFARAPEFTVMFIPGEAFLSAAAQHDPTLIEEGMRRGIIITTPTTFVALLRAVAHGWRQSAIEANARQISDAGRELYERAGAVFRHIDDLGARLRGAVDAYNRAIGSINSRLLPAARRLKDLGAGGAAADLASLEPVEAAPRVLEPPPGERPSADSPSH